MNRRTYIVVHGGAGVHSKNSEPEVKKALRLACTQALASENASALSLVENSIVSLEDSPLLNAGYGSNLTLDGTVECDAAIMDGRTDDFGSVGAVSGVKNPIRLARRILEHARTPDPLGRIPPLTLVSTGAHAFARSTSLDLVPSESLIAPRAQKQWDVWTARLNAPGSVPVIDAPMEEEVQNPFQDTVGAVAFVGASGELASGVSSGGILLKYPGRIGEAAVFGAGCWAQAPAPDSDGRRRKVGMACSVSGAGEYIVRASLARRIRDTLNTDTAEDVDVHAILHRVLADDFWIPSRSPSNPDPSAGVILLTTEEDEDGQLMGRLWCAFTTPSMAIAYASSENPLGKALILRRPAAVEARPNDHPRIFVTGFAL
ncbi:nucleophile aminohydrolase [Mycena capillaripes]|nr:nucleophile aminohydrolase [Mycena capillaripes]